MSNLTDKMSSYGERLGLVIFVVSVPIAFAFYHFEGWNVYARLSGFSDWFFLIVATGIIPALAAGSVVCLFFTKNKITYISVSAVLGFLLHYAFFNYFFAL
jgi:hypothetical protein